MNTWSAPTLTRPLVPGLLVLSARAISISCPHRFTGMTSGMFGPTFTLTPRASSVLRASEVDPRLSRPQEGAELIPAVPRYLALALAVLLKASVAPPMSPKAGRRRALSVRPWVHPSACSAAFSKALPTALASELWVPILMSSLRLRSYIGPPISLSAVPMVELVISFSAAVRAVLYMSASMSTPFAIPSSPCLSMWSATFSAKGVSAIRRLSTLAQYELRTASLILPSS